MAVCEYLPLFFIASSVIHFPCTSLSRDSRRSLTKRNRLTKSAWWSSRGEEGVKTWVDNGSFQDLIITKWKTIYGPNYLDECRHLLTCMHAHVNRIHPNYIYTNQRRWTHWGVDGPSLDLLVGWPAMPMGGQWLKQRHFQRLPLLTSCFVSIRHGCLNLQASARLAFTQASASHAKGVRRNWNLNGSMQQVLYMKIVKKYKTAWIMHGCYIFRFRTWLHICMHAW